MAHRSAAQVRGFAGMRRFGEPQLFAQADDVGFNVALGEPAVELVLAEESFEIGDKGGGDVVAFGFGPDQTFNGGRHLGLAPGDPALVPESRSFPEYSDHAAMNRSLDRLLAMGGPETVMIFGHDPAEWGERPLLPAARS
ncbi:hypothetical protein [Phenylobacterium sp.]|uniref:hypothetical protein n=1 Tax=Phenylobacterium sp. TaxID=1871053 RepID=UPI002E3357C2|nr:hypothetical protein [Phenylobacterium sp.]HEX4712759.1 hypothetical protein [Phenylobacterium sp.]